jgi:hypothetical protein
LSFFTAAAFCALSGMIWGVVMASSNDHTMMPAHAHLNLLGWATLALMGTFYALSGQQSRLGWVNFVLSFGAVVVTIPALAMLLGGDTKLVPVTIVGSIMAIFGMLAFILVLLSTWRSAKPA